MIFMAILAMNGQPSGFHTCVEARWLSIILTQSCHGVLPFPSLVPRPSSRIVDPYFSKENGIRKTAKQKTLYKHELTWILSMSLCLFVFVFFCCCFFFVITTPILYNHHTHLIDPWLVWFSPDCPQSGLGELHHCKERDQIELLLATVLGALQHPSVYIFNLWCQIEVDKLTL